MNSVHLQEIVGCIRFHFMSMSQTFLGKQASRKLC